MPTSQKHRGKHPKDDELFSGSNLDPVRLAVGELSWLLSRGYSGKSALTLAGDRHRLAARQRMAVERCACSNEARDVRKAKAVAIQDCRGEKIVVDGYNLLITVECALSGGIILKGRDGAIRDIASVHGTYKRVEETTPALSIISETLTELGAAGVLFLLDAPVSNSGRLKALILDDKSLNSDNWEVMLLNNPDKMLAESDMVVVTSDSWVLDRCRRWLNLASYIISRRIPDACVLDMEPEAVNGQS